MKMRYPLVSLGVFLVPPALRQPVPHTPAFANKLTMTASDIALCEGRTKGVFQNGCLHFFSR